MARSIYGVGPHIKDITVVDKVGKRAGKAYRRKQKVGSAAVAKANAGRGRGAGSAVALMGVENVYANDPMVFGGDGTEESPYIVQDPRKALELLEGDHYISLEQPREVSMLIEEMQKIALDAKARGEDAPDYNICRVTMPGKNVFCEDHKGILREDMPQLSGVPIEGSPASYLPKNDKGEVDLSDGFMAHMQSMGYEIELEERPASELRATQSELIGAKVAGMSYALEAGKIPRKPIYITEDGYIIDGHHRYAAHLALDLRSPETITMPVYVIKAPILEVLGKANDFSAEQGIPQRGSDDKSG